MLTARDSDIDHVVGLELGADDYVIKPVEPRVLVARIQALLRRGRSPDPVERSDAAIRYALDQQRRTIRRAPGSTGRAVEQ